DLAERHVERADATADGGRQRALDTDDELLERGDRLVGEPVLEAVERLFAGEDLHPGDLALAAVRLLDGRVEDRPARAPDVGTGAVALDEGNDGAFGDVEFPRGAGADRVAGGDGDVRVGRHGGSFNCKPAGGASADGYVRVLTALLPPGTLVAGPSTRFAPLSAMRFPARWSDSNVPASVHQPSRISHSSSPRPRYQLFTSVISSSPRPEGFSVRITSKTRAS